MRLLPPEAAHRTTIQVLKRISPSRLPRSCVSDSRLNVSAFGLTFPTPIGLAAGFDKDAKIWRQMIGLGFGHVEVGTVTPKPQAGNPRPRLFRLVQDRAVINRMGFPNGGHDVVLNNVQNRRKHDGILGINIGLNKTQENAASDYISGVQVFAPHADYITINISSPNTPALRKLQGKHALTDLLHAILSARLEAQSNIPILLKVAPDLDESGITDIVEVVMQTSLDGRGVDGLIVSNTTVARPQSLISSEASEAGGLSGAPLFEMSNNMLRRFRKATGGHVPLVGVGGVTTAADAWAKITAGASLIQIYTGMVYAGPQIIGNITRGLLKIMDREGIKSISDAIGRDAHV